MDRGTGKSEIAANLAYFLATMGVRTWILDSNTISPRLDLLFGIQPGERTFGEFLSAHPGQGIPCYDLSMTDSFQRLPLFLTCSGRGARQTLFDVQGKFNPGANFSLRLTEAVFHAMQNHRIELFLVDTHPGEKEINEAFLGIADILLVISRINDSDLERLRLLLRERSVIDVSCRLIIFNNVVLDEKGRAVEDMSNRHAVERHREIQLNPSCGQGIRECEELFGEVCGRIEVFNTPFLFSEKLASFRQDPRGNRLFSKTEQNDRFSQSLEMLAKRIME